MSETHLDDLAAAVADGTAVDWSRAEAEAEPAERAAIEQLRLLAGYRGTTAAPAAWGRLTIRGEIGSGAFGTVYRAFDSTLEREVALKLVPAGPRPAGGSPLVVHEGRLLARVRHPNVVTVYGADSDDGFDGLWMELLSGRTLRAIVESDGPYNATEAATLGRDICRALAAVHLQGIVHRDVKAQNVMREAGGRAVLMDFGAGAVTDATAADTALRGTPAYVAPEVFEGAAPTPQSDLYAVGVLLFYLVSGTFPVLADTIDGLRQAHAAGRRRALSDVRPDVPPAFERIVDHAMAADPAARPESAGQLAAMLDGLLAAPDAGEARENRSPRPSNRMRRRLVSAVFAAVTLGIAALVWLAGNSGPGTPAAATPRRDSIAILPFRDISGQPDDYLSEGITDELTDNLATIGNLRVIAGTSMAAYRDVARTPMQIGQELGVATALQATVRRAGGTLQIVAELFDTATGAQIWSGRFERPLGNAATLKTEIARRIALALKTELSDLEVARLRGGRPTAPEVVDLYLRGRHEVAQRTDQTLQRAVILFRDALVRDPGFAPAQAGLAEAYIHMGVYGSLPTEEAFPRAEAAARAAVKIDPQLAEAHATLGFALKNRFQWREAEDSLTRAIALKPSDANAHQWYSVLLTQLGRFAQAKAEIKTAISLDPLSRAPALQLAALLMMERRYGDAVAQFERVQQMDRPLDVVERHIAMSLAYQKAFVPAWAAFQRAADLAPLGAEDQELKADMAVAYCAAGRRDEAQRILQQLEMRYTRAGEHVAGSIAAVYAALNRRDEALAWLARARASHDSELAYLLVDPKWDNLRSDPRFEDNLRALGFPQPRVKPDGSQ
jgi:serine/threonine-protein kinase